MAQYDPAAVRQRLSEERQRLESDIYERTRGEAAVVPAGPFLGAGGMTTNQADDADTVNAAERNQAMLRNSQALLERVNAALARLDSGTYGVCESCGKEISPRRLEALPYATLCVDCQAKMERH